MSKTYKVKIEYIEQIYGYILLVLIDGKWTRCGGNNFIKVWDLKEDVEAYVEENDNLQLVK